MADYPQAGNSLVADVAAGLKSGMSESAAVNTAIGIRDATPEQKTYARDSIKLMMEQGDTLQKNFRSMIDEDPHFQSPTLFGGAPDAREPGRIPTLSALPPEMINQFRTNYERYLITTGNNAVAQQKAYDQVAQAWGISNINSPYDAGGSARLGMNTNSTLFAGRDTFQYMQYPPVTKNDNPRVVTQLRYDIENEFKDILAPGEKIIIASDSQTQRLGQDGYPVSYAVQAIDGDKVTLIGRWMRDDARAERVWQEAQKARTEQLRKTKVQDVPNAAILDMEMLQNTSTPGMR
jgi:hypothetical protein